MLLPNSIMFYKLLKKERLLREYDWMLDKHARKQWLIAFHDGYTQCWMDNQVGSIFNLIGDREVK